ncbi:succinoglycan biosynthesis protein ExoV [Mesorhizobium soli]|uniref:polysaccharide pyruvyl transferase family protein n=1 Tax=Pseudaminobacter soli (ex Li et al. 2025) TaxID=1295366 RepID=UPI002476416A|nr:polysaccharide pyruvyl transferase family protein [Mesorhizobium soli]MDH6230349.1 succinoglycan biosynthesis protein ExoV [Mesorhizobium soli]
MHPFYWESAHGNFGDDLNLWLWDFLLPGFRDVHPDVLLVGVGTVLNRALLPGGVKKLVVGSGFGYGSLPDFSDAAEWDVRCVRGPLTAGKLGLHTDLGVIDPAVMVAEMPEFRNLPKTGGAIFVPHWESTVGGLWPVVCKTAGLGYVDPCGEAKSVIRAIAQADLVVAESMHAAILADAFRVPWVAVSTSRSINSFKWQDWATSLGVTYSPRHVPISSRAEAITKGARFWGMEFEGRAQENENPNSREFDESLVMTRAEPSRSSLRGLAKQALAMPSTLALWQARRAKPQLSSDAALAERKERFREVLDGIRRDYL